MSCGTGSSRCYRDRLGRSAPGTRLRFRDDLLAASATVEHRRCLRPTAATSTARKGGSETGPSPVNRAKPGSKHHLITDGYGTPLAVITTGANVPDISKAIDLLDAVPPIRGRRGRPRYRFPVLLADKGYDSQAFRDACRKRGTEPIIPKRKTTGIKGLGKLRYVVEQTFALLHQFRRLAVRWERRLDIHNGFISLACILICWRRLIKWADE